MCVIENNLHSFTLAFVQSQQDIQCIKMYRNYIHIIYSEMIFFVLISLTANVFDKKKDQGVRMLYASVNTLNTQFDMLVSLH